MKIDPQMIRADSLTICIFVIIKQTMPDQQSQKLFLARKHFKIAASSINF